MLKSQVQNSSARKIVLLDHIESASSCLPFWVSPWRRGVVFSSLLKVGALFLAACSGMQTSEEENRKQQNATGEFIYRRQDEIVYAISPIEMRVREKYPWEKSYIGAFPKITKEWFRCKGSNAHPPQINKKGEAAPEYRYDCAGATRHSLPMHGEEEFVYPILIELLNEIQAKTNRQIIITCGHRCPQHNLYADPSSKAQASKHMIGAEVDFYVQGYEYQPEIIIKYLLDYYKQSPSYKGKEEFQTFIRYDKGDLDVSTFPWYNKEIFIKLYKKNEGRDFDNRHPYPYISVQIRFDRDAGEKVTYSWPKANNGFRRY